MAGINEYYITISNSEYNYLINNIRNNQITTNQAENRYKAQVAASKQVEIRINELENKILKMDKNASDSLNKMYSEMVSVNRQQQDYMKEQIKRCREALNLQSQNTKEAIEKERIKTEKELSILREVVYKELTLQRTKSLKEIAMIREKSNDIIKRIEKIEETSENHQKYAQYWIEQTNGLIKDIIKLRHELFTPDELEKIKKEIDNAVSDINAKAFQTAMVTGRNAFNTASDLRMRIINAENEWNYIYAIWQQELAQLVSDFNDSEELFFEVDTTEGKEKIQADLDYWTNGKFQLAKAEFDKLKLRMSNIENIVTNNIYNALNELQHIRDQLMIIRKISKENIMFSYNRYMQGCLFYDILRDNFAMTDCEGDYEGRQQRDSYIGIYKNPVSSDKIVVKIIPVSDEVGIMSKNKLEIHFLTTNNNEEQRQKWTCLIESELKKQGLDVGSFRGRKGYENCPSDQVQMADIEWVRQK